MPNDAKLGFVAGVVLVLAVAILFFQREAPTQPLRPQAASVAPMESARPAYRGRLPVRPVTLVPVEEPGGEIPR